jgi:hypothetical protein
LRLAGEPDPSTADWHTFGMEWKEHVAWIAPILATVAAGLVVYYGAARNPWGAYIRPSIEFFAISRKIEKVHPTGCT